MEKKSSKIKILHIVESFGGGVYTMVKSISEGVCGEFDETIAYGLRAQTKENFESEIDGRIKLIRVENFTREINPIKDIKAFFEIRRLVKSENPDVVHLHSSKAGFLGRFAISRKKHKIFYTPHGFAFLDSTSSFLHRLAYKTAEIVAALKGGITVCCSEGEYNEAIPFTKRICVVNNGIDLSRMPETKFRQIGVLPMNIATVGRICTQKNPELFNSIALKIPECNFLWIGDGELRDCINAGNTYITGWKEHDEAIELANQQDIFILTSRLEGLSVALLESMYLRKVCIVTPVVGSREVIEHGKNGFTATTADEFVKIIKDIAKGKYDIDAITESARNDVIEKYSTEIMINKYSALYSGRRLEEINSGENKRHNSVLQG